MNETIVLDTPEGINFFQLARVKAALKLEMIGLKNSRGSVYAYAKRAYGLKGSKQKVYEQLCAMVEQKIQEPH